MLTHEPTVNVGTLIIFKNYGFNKSRGEGIEIGETKAIYNSYRAGFG